MMIMMISSSVTDQIWQYPSSWKPTYSKSEQHQNIKSNDLMILENNQILFYKTQDIDQIE